MASQVLYASPIVLAVEVFLMILLLLCNVSVQDVRMCTEFLKLILDHALKLGNLSAVSIKRILDSIPNQVSTMYKTLELLPDTTSYICCPKCFALYEFNSEASKLIEKCTYKETPSSVPCGRNLYKNRYFKGRKYNVPVKKYTQHSLKKWLGRFMCRKDIESYLDHNPYETGAAQGEMKDMWDGPELQEFCGPDGEPFVKKDGKGGKYIFGLCMDGFNPYQNRQAGKKVSVSAIYMVCLNLPPSLRYKLENMFLVAIIPGPSSPSLHQINHLLDPLVDELLEFWNDGVRYSKTPNHTGKLVNCALIPLISDLPALRQMIGFTSHSANKFCCFCFQTLDDIDNINIDSWEKRTYTFHYECAMQWKNAKSEKERQILYETNGIRFSSLLRLTYWDPIKFSTIDTMHALLLGNLQRHCRNIWGMDIKLPDGDRNESKSIYNQSAPSESEIIDGIRTLRIGTKNKLSQLRVPVLRYLCEAKQVMPVKDKHKIKKRFLMEALVNFVSVRIYFDLKLFS